MFYIQTELRLDNPVLFDNPASPLAATLTITSKHSKCL